MSNVFGFLVIVKVDLREDNIYLIRSGLKKKKKNYSLKLVDTQQNSSNRETRAPY